MRVVVDTIFFVSSFFGGIHRKIADLWKRGRIILCLSKPIVEKYVIECAVAWPSRGDVLLRSYTYDRESANLSRDALEDLLDAIAPLSEHKGNQHRRAFDG